jgi:Reverse transcriptase (RNA-dependent DNA polymerase).
MKDLANDWIAKKKMNKGGPSPWLSNAFPVPKKVAGEWRGVIDYREVNEQIQMDAYPLPRIGDILERQGRRHMWTIIDLKDAFSQIPMDEESARILAISTPEGVLHPRCMPQGYKIHHRSGRE